MMSIGYGKLTADIATTPTVAPLRDVHATVSRPFYFLLSLWGEKYRNYFVDRCLPTLLAPGNFSVLRSADGHRLLIATTRSDWEAMEGLPIMAKAREYVTPQFVEVGLPDADSSPGGEGAIRHHAKCQKQLCEIAFRDRAYGSVVFPDTLYSTGFVASLLRYARAGHRLVLCAALRQTEEDVLAEFAATGALPMGSKLSLSAQPLAISQREMADIAIRHLHPEVIIYDWDFKGAPALSAHRFWRVPGQRGLILRTFYGLPVLMDYGSIETHDVDCLERDIFENVYVRQNFSAGGLYVVRDLDEFMLISLTPEAIGHRYIPRRLPGPSWLQKLDREIGLRAAMNYFVGRTGDRLKGALFNSPMFWHAGDLDGVWEQMDLKISRLMRRLVGDYGLGRQATMICLPHHYSLRPLRLLGDLNPNLISRLCIIGDAIKGRGDARSRIGTAIARRMRHRDI